MKSQITYPGLYWFARIGAILAIGFIGIFALDSFENGQPLSDQLAHFGIHLIPAMVLLGAFILSCFLERVGGIIFLLIGLGLAPVIYLHNYNLNHSIGTSLGIIAMINLPFFLVGLAFLVRGIQKTRTT